MFIAMLMIVNHSYVCSGPYISRLHPERIRIGVNAARSSAAFYLKGSVVYNQVIEVKRESRSSSYVNLVRVALALTLKGSI